ncbi:hypothetical protein PSTG_05323 [Puccinia striiformis f. sp. tritici PST-78]|uniref:Uncharacterized protein n=1 Tax=Puccinia striiformis f. sp. tritici PST-78 TaxID=1165861 RepID=A0A0L0VQI4_9BASI|nr:hypothetical protein PSTG_05323 [Puccinia striiformis f. sp. tritici PST-78]
MESIHSLDPGFYEKQGLHSRYTLNNIDSYKLWMETVANCGLAKTTLSLEMSNPSKVAKLAHQAQVLAKMAFRKKTANDKAEARAAKLTKQKAANTNADDQTIDHGEEEEEDEDDDGDDMKLYIRQIHKKNLANILYERHLPIYIHPGDPARYVVLTRTVVQEWGRVLCIHKDGVTDETPLPVVSNTIRNLPTNTHVNPPRVATINKYIDFLGFKDTWAQEIIKTLVDNDLQRYQISASPNLDGAALRGLNGLTLGLWDW